MILVNFAHPLTEEQQNQIVALTGELIDRVIDVPSQIDPQKPLPPQIVAMADAAGLERVDWHAENILVNLPSLNFSAAALLAELYGRMGYLPPVLRLRPVPGSLPPRYEVAEILNLYEIKDAARFRR